MPPMWCSPSRPGRRCVASAGPVTRSAAMVRSTGLGWGAAHRQGSGIIAPGVGPGRPRGTQVHHRPRGSRARRSSPSRPSCRAGRSWGPTHDLELQQGRAQFLGVDRRSAQVLGPQVQQYPRSGQPEPEHHGERQGHVTLRTKEASRLPVGGGPGSFACTRGATHALMELNSRMDDELGGKTTQARLDEVQGLVDASRAMIPDPWPGS